MSKLIYLSFPNVRSNTFIWGHLKYLYALLLRWNAKTKLRKDIFSISRLKMCTYATNASIIRMAFLQVICLGAWSLKVLVTLRKPPRPPDCILSIFIWKRNVQNDRQQVPMAHPEVYYLCRRCERKHFFRYVGIIYRQTDRRTDRKTDRQIWTYKMCWKMKKIHIN